MAAMETRLTSVILVIWSLTKIHHFGHLSKFFFNSKRLRGSCLASATEAVTQLVERRFSTATKP
jgi:hypothetical protein